MGEVEQFRHGRGVRISQPSLPGGEAVRRDTDQIGHSLLAETKPQTDVVDELGGTVQSTDSLVFWLGLALRSPVNMMTWA